MPPSWNLKGDNQQYLHWVLLGVQSQPSRIRVTQAHPCLRGERRPGASGLAHGAHCCPSPVLEVPPIRWQHTEAGPAVPVASQLACYWASEPSRGQLEVFSKKQEKWTGKGNVVNFRPKNKRKKMVHGSCCSFLGEGYSTVIECKHCRM